MSKIIAIANQKGGVGKTTTSVNLAASLAVAGKRALIVDVDPQGNSTTGLGIDRSNLNSGLYEALIDTVPLIEVVRRTDLPNLSIVPATRDLFGAEIELINFENRERRLKEALSSVQQGYDYVLLDCPPSLGLLTLNALTSADSLLVPLQSEYYALEGLSSLLETLKLVQKALNPELYLEGILITMFDSRNRLSHQVYEEIRTHFPDRLFRTVIHRNVRLSESPSHGKPVYLYDLTSIGARDYIELAKELIMKEEENHDAEKRIG